MFGRHRLSFSIFLFFLPHIATSARVCQESNCGKIPVKFPFQLTNNSDPTSMAAADRCVYPGFTLSCGQNGTTLITLPPQEQFIVRLIDYGAQALWINDQQNCLPRFFLHGFSLRDSPFKLDHSLSLTFLSCSSATEMPSYRYKRVECLSDESYVVLATPTYYPEDGPCEVISTVSVPVTIDSWLSGGIEADVRLSWSKPSCSSCEKTGQGCGFFNDSSPETRCFDPPGSNIHASRRPSNSNFRLIFLIVGLLVFTCIVGLVCLVGIIGFGCFIYKFRVHYGSNTTTELSTLVTTELSTLATQQPQVVVAGLDGPTIETYPKTLVGESKRLPKASDNTCPICLCEYQPKELLRTIPKCQHYFHANCIDAWLRLNASCPLCRDSATTFSL